IPSSVTSIGEAAFSDCDGLTSITIPESVTSIGDRAFERCYSLTSITACKMEPSEYNCSTIAFDYESYSSVTLYVPAGSASAYRALEPWSNFSNIVETDLTSIQTPTINSSETIVGYYNLQGQRIATPQRGQIVIVRYSDGTSRKMLVQ
ncbi:MAG: leucine-rich repeat domain-containing protein, partial [Bacteroidaceae bacterium]|nr:leucine-rich repeat domain-containing protein [Bacteroidaceae bacterium]